MNKFITLAAFIALSAHAQDHHEVTVFDERIVVEVNTQTQTGFNEEPYWNMLQEKGWKATKKVIEGHNISPELIDELNYQESVSILDKHLKKRRIRSAEQLLSAHPEWASCERIQWLWLDLKSESMTGYGPNAQKKYQSILDNCNGLELSTTQKLISWSNLGASRDILARYRGSKGYNRKLASQMEYDLSLSRLESSTVSQQALDNIGRSVKVRKDAKTAEILAWKYMESEQPKAAFRWFEYAINWGGANKKRIEGKLLSLQSMGETEHLQREIQVWSKEYPSIANMEIGKGEEEAIACETSIAQCLQILNDKPSLTAQEFTLKGWKLYELRRPMSAAIAFEKALDLMSTNDPKRDLTQYGYVLSLEKIGYADRAQTLAMKIDDVEKRAEIEKKVAIKRVYSTFQAEDYNETISRIDEYEKYYGKDAKLIEIKAWALYNSQRKEEALQEYTVLSQAFPHDKDVQRSYLIIKCGFTKNAPVCRDLYSR